MPRPEDIAWKFVVRLDGKRWCCPYCHKVSSGSVTRVKGHFLKQPKEGIASCTKVPEHICTLMELLLNHEVHNKEDIAWKFVDRVEDNKWRCHYCSVEFSGDLRGVKGHLLKVPNEGISICTEVPDHAGTLMRSLLDEVAEEGSRGANSQSSLEPQSRGMPAQAEVAEDESGEANGESSMVPQSCEMSTQVEVAEEESRDANSQSFIEPLQTPLSSPDLFSQDPLEQMVPQFMTVTDIGVNSDQQSQVERQLHPISTEPLSVQSSHGQPQCSIRSQMPMNDQQTPAGESASQYDQLPAVGNLNCLQDGNQHSQLQILMHSDPSIASQHTIDSHVTEELLAPLMENYTSDQQVQPALLSPQHQCVLHQSINHETRDMQQNATMPLDNQDTTRQPDLHDSLLENLVESLRVIVNAPEEIQTNEHNPTVGSSLQNDLSFDVDSTNCLQDCSQPCVVEEVPLLGNTNPTDAVQHYDHLHSRCDKEDGNDTHVPSPTPMDIDPSTVDPRVLEAATNTRGPLSSQDMNRGSPIMNVGSIRANDEEIRNLKRKVEELDNKEAVIKEQMEIESAASSVWKKPRILVERWLKETERARNNFQIIGQANAELPPKEQVETVTREVEELIGKTLPQTLLIEERDAKVDTFLERELTGEAIHRNIELIWGHLKKNHACKLGICGMGGVGRQLL
ncbi:uncharacterized protein LOC104451421 [Eucalyptus grandis]|uniref:uncharacterized protein LOC104451421 n=1 Tax=Eucalyptus grandis TaxID=71139 RepID=UPI00192EA21B|nr:uncharacterized protein LOC104451421 [Eucalyptus grandis]